MKRLGIKRISFLLLIITILSMLGTNVNAFYEDEQAVTAIAESGEYIDCLSSAAVSKGDVNVSSRIYELLFGKDKNKKEEIYLIPGGDVFGIGVAVGDVAQSGETVHKLAEAGAGDAQCVACAAIGTVAA